MTDEPLLRIVDLKKHFPVSSSLLTRLRPDHETENVRAVDGVELTVNEGETLGLVGESGCGKSTLARAALRLVEPTDGAIYYRDDEVTAYDAQELREFRSKAQMIYQDPFASLNPRYTVRRTLVEPMAVHGIGDLKRDRDERAATLLERVGLSSRHLDRHPHEFSGGQRQRIAIARALAVEPSLIVADEPVSALDVSVQAQILNLLGQIREEMGLSILFISHDLSTVRRICDRIAVMYLGEIVEIGATHAVFHNPAHPYTESLLSSIPVPDPSVERERIVLEGDVPTPIDPPSGCRFHPRCPRVIAPEGWTGTQKEWRRVFHFRKSVENGSVNPNAVRQQLELKQENVTDLDVVEEIYEEHITQVALADREIVTLSDDVEETVRSAIASLVSGERERTLDLLAAEFTSVCQTDVPRKLSVADRRMVLCHLYDPQQPGTPEQGVQLHPDLDGEK
jgi:peptide/nickel transport system ATP-binding protein